MNPKNTLGPPADNCNQHLTGLLDNLYRLQGVQGRIADKVTGPVPEGSAVDRSSPNSLLDGLRFAAEMASRLANGAEVIESKL